MSLLVGGTTSAWGIAHARACLWLVSLHLGCHPPPPTPLTQREGPGPENQRTFRQLDKELRSLYCP